MTITATLKNSYQRNSITVSTNDREQSVLIHSKSEGYGSSVNGGELLFLSLATCFCNDIYREAAKRHMKVDSVEVTVSGEFGGESEPASNIVYQVNVRSESPRNDIDDLISYVDKIAEIHNTLRKGVSVSLRNDH